ncbi:MAG: hypothetical protein CTY26_00775 [Methylophilus sp.]|nr:MAG: hypothetical protein CTY26_00775 [Methylophilus sp.]
MDGEEGHSFFHAQSKSKLVEFFSFRGLRCCRGDIEQFLRLRYGLLCKVSSLQQGVIPAEAGIQARLIVNLVTI